MATHKTQSRKEPAPLPASLQKDQPANPKESRTQAAASKEKSPEIPKNPADRPTEEPNVYIEVVQKRLRAVKKRLTKIERNEELKAQGQVLDQDQLKSVAQKQEVVDLIHELEELVKHLTEVVLEEEKALKALKKKQAKEEARQAKIQEEQHEENVRQFLQVLYVLNLFGGQETRDLFLSGGVDGFTLSQGELEELDSLSIALQGTYESSTGLAEASKLYQGRLAKLLARSSEKITEKKTYAQARDLLQKVFTSSHFDTAVAARLVEERAAAAAAEAARIAAEAAAAAAAAAAAEAALREQEELQKSYEIIQLTEVPAFSPHSPEQINGQPGPALAFTHESEILGGVQPIVSFDGSSAVFVPIPQSLFNPHTAPLPFTFPSAFTAPLPSAQPQQPQQPADAPQQAPQEPPKEAAPAPQEVAQEDQSERAPANGNRRGNNRPNYDRNYRNRDGYQGERQYPDRDRQYPERQYQDRQYQDRQYQDRAQYHDRERDRYYQDRERQERPAHHDRQYQDRPHQDGGYQRRGANNGAPRARARGRGGNSNRGRGGEAGQEGASH